MHYKGYVYNRPKYEPTDSYFSLERHISKCMVRTYAFNLHVEPVGTEITGTQHIPISHVCSLDDIRSKGIIGDRNLLHVCYMSESESEIVIVDEISMEESKS